MNKSKLRKDEEFLYYFRFFFTSESNIFINIGVYGILLIVLIVILTPWFTTSGSMTEVDLILLMPAWDETGHLNHLLGTDQNGKDIFQNLLRSFRTSLLSTFVISLCVIIVGSLISLVAIFIKPVSDSIIIFFRMITAIPPLLMAIIISMFNGNTLMNLIVSITISMLPRFIYNIYNMVRHEIKKTYIVAFRLDGLSSFKIMWHCVIPNILSNYIAECIHCYTISLLSLTTLTFLSFGTSSRPYELGMMMRDMIDLLPFNQWAFLAPGLAIMTLIILLNFLNFGLQQYFSQQN